MNRTSLVEVLSVSMDNGIVSSTAEVYGLTLFDIITNCHINAEIAILILMRGININKKGVNYGPAFER
jgi:hypothetical protein